MRTNILFLLFFFPIFSSADIGDVNNDKQINGADIVSIYNYIMLGKESNSSPLDCDLNYDNAVNGADIVQLYNYIVNKSQWYPLFKTETEILENNQQLSIPKNSVKSYKKIIFEGDISEFDSNTSIVLGHGSAGDYLASWVEISNHQIISHIYKSSDNPTICNNNFNITKNIKITISKNLESSKADIRLESNGEILEQSIPWIGDNGTTGGIYAYIRNGKITNAKLIWSSMTLQSKVWLFGDSYFSLDDPARWTTYLIENGHDQYLLDAFSGSGSTAILEDFKNLLQLSKPKYAIWCMGMNNKDNASGTTTAASPNAVWLKATKEFIELCKQNDIIPILSTTPTVVGGKVSSDSGLAYFRYHGAKNSWVKESGCRYVDFAYGVGADDETGHWFGEGTPQHYLEGTNDELHTRVHPTTYGAQALYNQFMKDCYDIFE